MAWQSGIDGMAKLKVTRKKRTVVKTKAPAAKKSKKGGARGAKRVVTKTVRQTKVTRKTAAAGTKKRAAKKTVSLGRPKVVGDEKLYLLFHDDYHARQIFEFLRVETVKELEQFSPQEIVDRLSAPIVITVQRIRRFLAEQNRALAGDEEFAAQHKASAK